MLWFQRHNGPGRSARKKERKKEKENEQGRTRDARLDLIRALAIVAVVFIHCIENYYSLHSVLCYLFGRMGVPLFVMLTGATMVSRDYQADSDLKDYAIRLLKLYLICVFWLFVYRFHDASIYDNIILSLGLDSSAKHLWYLNVLFVIYLSLPFVSFLNEVSTKAVFIIWTVILFLTIAQTQLFMDLGNKYIYLYVYLIWGFLCCSRQLFEKESARILALGTLLFTLLSAALLKSNLVTAVYRERGLDIWWYNSIAVILPSLMLFPLLLKIRIRSSRFIEELSRCSFGIYIVHLFVISKLSPYISGINDWNGAAGTVLLCVCTLLVSFLVSYSIGRIPYMKKLIMR